MIAALTEQMQDVSRVADQLGEDKGRVRLKNMTWSDALSEGVILSLTIKRYRAQVGVTLADLGIQPASREEREALERTLSLGHRFLLPRETIRKANEIEGQARSWLLKNCFQTFIGRYIHVSRYARWREKNVEIQKAYYELADEIVRDYPDLMTQMQRDYRQLGAQVCARLIASGVLSPLTNTQDWASMFTERALAGVLSAEAIRDSFTYEWDVAVVPLQASVAKDRAEADRITLVSQEKAKLEAASLMEQDLRATEMKRVGEGVSEFVKDLQSQIRNAVYEAAIDGLDALKKGQGKLPRGTTWQLKNLIQQVQDLVFWDDPELESRIATLSRVVGIPAQQRSAEDVEYALKSLGSEARLVLMELDRPPERSGKSLGVPDDLPDLLVAMNRVSRDADQEDFSMPDISEIGMISRGGRSLE